MKATLKRELWQYGSFLTMMAALMSKCPAPMEKSHIIITLVFVLLNRFFERNPGVWGSHFI